MRAVVCHKLGSIESLRVEEIAEPIPGSSQVLVEVEAAGLSYLDVLLASGTYQVTLAPPFIPGGEFAGRVVQVGSDVAELRVGDLVVGETIVGALAERVAAHVTQLVPLPQGIAFPVAATMLQSYSTAIYALTRRTSVQSGESVLVLGAGGGVGLACVDVATSLGARVFAVASTQEKRLLATSLGAVAVIDPSHEDVKQRARELSSGGLNVVVDPVGGALADSALRALGYGGRYLVVGFASGSIPAIPLNLILLNSREMIGVEFGAETARNPDLARTINYEVVSGVAGKRFHPIAPAVSSLERAAEGLRALRDREIAGKLAIVTRLTTG